MVKAIPPNDAPISNSEETNHNHLFFVRSITDSRKGFNTHGRYSQPVYKVMSTLLNPNCL